VNPSSSLVRSGGEGEETLAATEKLMWLKDKRCLIVGGTSGLGHGRGGRFLEERRSCLIAAKNRPRVGAHAVRCDATLSDEVDALFADSVSYLGGLDVLYEVLGGSGRIIDSRCTALRRRLQRPDLDAT